jgi:copper(I)-binding protein
MMVSSLPTRCAAAISAVALACATIAGCSSSHHSTAATSTSTSSAPAGTAHASIGNLTLTGGYIPQPASPDVAAAYVTVANSGAVADTIVKVTTSVTADVMAMTETNAGGVGTMTDLSSVTIPAHGSVSLTPGHSHLMLENPTRQLKQGETVSMTITFATAGTVTLSMPVVPLTGPVISSGNMSGMPGMGG